MATQTTNYGLTKPDGNDAVDISILNQNFDLIDAQLKKDAVIKGTITLSETWNGEGPYTQSISIQGSTENSKIDLQADASVVTKLIDAGVSAVFVQNNDGNLTVIAVGNKPVEALTFQYTRTEVE